MDNLENKLKRTVLTPVSVLGCVVRLHGTPPSGYRYTVLSIHFWPNLKAMCHQNKIFGQCLPPGSGGCTSVSLKKKSDSLVVW